MNMEGEMENTPSKDDGYALPDKDDPWALGDSQRPRPYRFSLQGRKLRPPARIRAPGRAKLPLSG
jgi:hypothetical protein